MVSSRVIKQQLSELQSRAYQLQMRIKPRVRYKDNVYNLLGRKLEAVEALIGAMISNIDDNKVYPLAKTLEYGSFLHSYQEIISALHDAIYEYKTEDRKILDAMNGFVDELYCRINFDILEQTKPDPICVAYGRLVAHSTQFGILMTPHNDVVYFWNWGLLAHELGHFLTADETFLAKLEASMNRKKILSEFDMKFKKHLRKDRDYSEILTRWNVELICDVIGFMLAGIAYSFPFVDRIINPAISVSSAELESSHPLDEIRYKLQLRLLGEYGFDGQIPLIQGMWGGIVRSTTPVVESIYEDRGNVYSFADFYAGQIMETAEVIKSVIRPMAPADVDLTNRIIDKIKEKPVPDEPAINILNALWILAAPQGPVNETILQNIRTSLIKAGGR